MLTTAVSIRPASPADRFRLDHLIHSTHILHNHLDWRPPHEWLGQRPFHFALLGDRVVGALAAPPDPPGVAWIRLAAVAAGYPIDGILNLLWDATLESWIDLRVSQVSCMLIDHWLKPHLQRRGFALLNDVIVLRRQRGAARPVAGSLVDGVRLRSAKSSDIEAMTAADNAAFAPPWQYSASVIQRAMGQARFATVAEAGKEVVGYQISSGGREGGHLARLAVYPHLQGQGIGRALVSQVVEHFERRGASQISVNTQRDNAPSIAIYRAFGFEITDEHYEVWQFTL